MDICAGGIILGSLVLYFVSKRHKLFLFTLGVGLGLLWGALWATYLVYQTFGR